MNKPVYAKSKYVRRPARKLRLVVDMIRGKKAIDALDILKFSSKDAALDVYKVVYSAISNAVSNHSMNKKDLQIVQAYVDEAPTFKRGIAVSRGRYHQILKRNSHIIIGVDDNPLVKTNTEVKASKAEISKKASEVKKVEKIKTLKKTEKVTNSKVKKK